VRSAPLEVRACVDIVVPASGDLGVLGAFAWFFPDLAAGFADCQHDANRPFTGAPHPSTMLNDWVETPGDAAIDATHRADGEWPADPQLSGADDMSPAGSPGAHVAAGREVDRELTTRRPVTVSETDLLYWFG